MAAVGQIRPNAAQADVYYRHVPVIIQTVNILQRDSGGSVLLLRRIFFRPILTYFQITKPGSSSVTPPYQQRLPLLRLKIPVVQCMYVVPMYFSIYIMQKVYQYVSIEGVSLLRYCNPVSVCVQVENFTWDDTETDVTKVALSFYSGTDLLLCPVP